MRNRQSITLSAALLAAAGGLAGCKPTEAAGPDPLTVERRVVVAQVQPAAGAPQSYTGIRIDLEGQVNRLDVLLGAQPGTYAARSMRKWIKPGAQTWRPLARYRQTVLRAAEDVEDAFKTLVELEARTAQLEAETRSLQRSRDLSQQAFAAGSIPLTDVLDADRQLLVARDTLAQNRGDAVRAFRELGGGWTE